MANAKKHAALHAAADKVGNTLDAAKRRSASIADRLADVGKSRPVAVASATVGVAAGIGVAGLVAYGLASLGESLVAAASL